MRVREKRLEFECGESCRITKGIGFAGDDIYNLMTYDKYGLLEGRTLDLTEDDLFRLYVCIGSMLERTPTNG